MALPVAGKVLLDTNVFIDYLADFHRIQQRLPGLAVAAP